LPLKPYGMDGYIMVNIHKPKIRLHAMSDEEKKLQEEKIILMKMIDKKFDAMIELLQDIKKCTCFDYERNMCEKSLNS
jgi:RNase P subunit RPR2